MKRRALEHDKLAPTPGVHSAEAVVPLAPRSARGARPARVTAPETDDAPATAETPSRGPSRRDTRARCAHCTLRNECASVRDDGGVCPLEADSFSELGDPIRVPGILRDVLRAELRTFFRAKRLEARTGGPKIDAEASKLALALFKQVESYLDICQRLRGPVGPQPAGPAAAAVFPNLEAALAASQDALFSEVADAEARERLRRQYVEALRREDAVLREVERVVGG